MNSHFCFSSGNFSPRALASADLSEKNPSGRTVLIDVLTAEPVDLEDVTPVDAATETFYIEQE